MPLQDLPGDSGAGESLAKRSTRARCMFWYRLVVWARWHWC